MLSSAVFPICQPFSTKRFGRGGRRSGKGEPSRSLPRYTWPDVISRVTTWPWKGELSARTLWQSSGLELRCEKAGCGIGTRLRLVQQLDRDADSARHRVLK